MTQGRDDERETTTAPTLARTSIAVFEAPRSDPGGSHPAKSDAPGNDCPQCSRRLRADGTCGCGWHGDAAAAGARCVECDARGRGLELDEDGVLRCAGCHVHYLRERAARDPISAEELARCRGAIEAKLGCGILP